MPTPKQIEKAMAAKALRESPAAIAAQSKRVNLQHIPVWLPYSLLKRVDNYMATQPTTRHKDRTKTYEPRRQFVMEAIERALADVEHAIMSTEELS